jgi:hypothetical protein
LREKGVSVDHLQLGTSGVSSELLRTVRKTAMPQLPPNAPLKDVRAALAHVEQRCAEAEEGHSASMLAVDSLLHVISTTSAMDNSSEAAVMQALPALASLAAKGAAARALLAAGAAAAIAETMLAHAVRASQPRPRPLTRADRCVRCLCLLPPQNNVGLLCEACTVLCVLGGGLLSPLGMSPEAAARERENREAMCDRVAAHAGAALVELGVRHADSQWVTLAVARAIGVIGRGSGAAQRLLEFGAVQVLLRALGRYVPDKTAYEVAHLSALAMVALAASSAGNADSVDRKGGRGALQQAVLANTTLARALGMEFPSMAAWLAGKANTRKQGPRALFACGGSPRAEALQPQAESLWLQVVREAAARGRQLPTTNSGMDAARRAAPHSAATSATASGTARLPPARAPTNNPAPAAALRQPPLPRRPAAPPAQQPTVVDDDDEDEDEDEDVLGQL